MKSSYPYVKPNFYFLFFQETHIIHNYQEDFYGSILKVCVAGHIRDEQNFSSIGTQFTILCVYIILVSFKIITN